MSLCGYLVCLGFLIFLPTTEATKGKWRICLMGQKSLLSIMKTTHVMRTYAKQGFMYLNTRRSHLLHPSCVLRWSLLFVLDTCAIMVRHCVALRCTRGVPKVADHRTLLEAVLTDLDATFWILQRFSVSIRPEAFQDSCQYNQDLGYCSLMHSGLHFGIDWTQSGHLEMSQQPSLCNC